MMAATHKAQALTIQHMLTQLHFLKKLLDCKKCVHSLGFKVSS
jgi:hypothetical protein